MFANPVDHSDRKLVRQQTPPKETKPVVEDYGKYEAPIKAEPSHDSLNYPKKTKKSEPKQADDPYFQEFPPALHETMDDQQIANIAGSIGSQ
jgi:hypothetical protein